jgi:glutamyl/glutaminyl-tRNA synthetase
MDQFFDDYILIKGDGLPVYHFAHFVDDLLMEISHVIRSDERLPSVPKHYQIYNTFAERLSLPPIRKYAHLSPVMKLDNGNKRKLSKRKDPEADVAWFLSQ